VALGRATVDLLPLNASFFFESCDKCVNKVHTDVTRFWGSRGGTSSARISGTHNT
jgi:hypothetical protein